MVTCTGHIGIHDGADGRTDVHDVMAIKPNFLTSMGSTSFPGSFLYFEKVPWLRLVTCLLDFCRFQKKN